MEPPESKPKKIESPYSLTMHQLTISVSGTLAGIKDLLNQLGSSGWLIQRRSLSLNPVRENRNQVVMDLELMLFDLTTANTRPG